jgi:hypothetical protein
MTINDVNLSVAFRGISSLSSWRKKGEELFLRKEVAFPFVKTLLKRIFACCTIVRVRKCLVFAGCTIARLRVFAGCTIARVRKCSYVGKTSIFSMLLEGENSMVRWHLNGLDLTRFHDLVGSS